MSHFPSAHSEKEKKKRKAVYLKGGQGIRQVPSDSRVMLAIQVFHNSDMEKCVNEKRQEKGIRRKKKRRKMCYRFHINAAQRNGNFITSYSFQS